MNNIININNKELPKLLLATTNAGKQRELCSLLQDCPIQLVVPSDLGIA
jgi:inosine/xanthosine triphosphate pyrophosphatase family protein